MPGTGTWCLRLGEVDAVLEQVCLALGGVTLKLAHI